MEKINIKIITYFLLIQPLLDISVVLIPKYPVAQFISNWINYLNDNIHII